MALPIIASSACGSYGPYDDLQPGVNGLVYPTGSIAPLASAIRMLVADARLRSQFGSMSRKYSLDAQTRSHGQFMRSALAADGLLVGDSGIDSLSQSVGV